MKLFTHAVVSTGLCCAVFATILPAQVLATPADETAPPSSPVVQNLPSAVAKDVQSIDGIVHALYEVISGGIGEKRDWNRMRSLFIPEARIMAIAPKPAPKLIDKPIDKQTVKQTAAQENQELHVRLMTLSDYIANSGPVLTEIGFREKELQRHTDQWGELAQVFTSYEAVVEKDGSKRRGINSLQLMYDGKRWWIISLLFEAERPNLALPENMATLQK